MLVPSVVIFSLKECPHCKRAKSLLDELGISYEEVSLTDYPEKRRDMLQLANRLTVPQIFIQGRHIGGAAELSALHAAGQLQRRLGTAKDALADDPRLRNPDYPPQPAKASPEAPEEPKIAVGSETMEYPALVKVLMDGIEVKDFSTMLGLCKRPQCFEGDAMVDFLQTRFELRSRGEALQVADQILHIGAFAPADNASAFSEKGLFRFQVHEARFDTALNIARRWCTEEGCVSDAVLDPLGTLKRLKGQLTNILTAHTDAEGMIDYTAVGEDPAMQPYDLAVAELQMVDIAGMEPNLRKAFLINLYNTIVPHAFAKVGIASSDLTRVAFFDGVSYVLGGKMDAPLSLNAMENGLLRGNRKAPGHMAKSIGRTSPHAGAVLECDHRIHFALNCGAKACPPVKWFTAEAIDEELAVVAMAWAEQEDNVKVDLASKTISLSMICSWYSADFGANKVEIATTLMQHTRGEKQEQMKEMLKGKFTLKHVKYDWSTNGKNARNFTGTNIMGLMGF